MNNNRGAGRARNAPSRGLANTGRQMATTTPTTGPSEALGVATQTRITPETRRSAGRGGSGSREQPGPPPNPFRLLRANIGPNPRLSMPLDSEDSSSEPDQSILGMNRRPGGPAPLQQQQQQRESTQYEDDLMSQDGYEDVDDTSAEEVVEEEGVAVLVDPAAAGLKEISNLGKFSVSSHKQGNGVQELRNDDLKLYWQSDGPQPHKLTVYFVKRVGIRDIRFFVDYNEDESYTPTKIVFKSGTSENNLIEFATMNMDSPVGWQQVPVAGAGGGLDGNTLVSYVLQMQILENHQNGKDTHLRGIKIYALDSDGATRDDGVDATSGLSNNDDTTGAEKDDTNTRLDDIAQTLAATRLEAIGGGGGFTIPDFMKEPEIR